MLNITDLNLSKNPFESTTPLPEEKIIWAGMHDVKEKITSIYREILGSNAKKVVLNWGPMGGGKTHAAYYFSSSGFTEQFTDFKIISIFCNIPYEGKDSSKVFLKRVVDSLKIDFIQAEIAHAKQQMGEEALKDYLVARTRSEIFSDTVLRLFTIQSNEIIQRYIYEGLSTNDLKKLHLSKSLKTDEDYFNFVIALLTCITACPDRRVAVWIDEMENMLYYQNKLYRTFGMMLREISDKVAERLLLFLNFTLTEPEEDTVKLLLGEALWTRINTKVRFNELTPAEANIYIQDIIQAFQIKKESLTPFDTDSVETLISSIPSAYLIPREINKRGDIIVNYSLENDYKSISPEVVSKALEG